jgi:hypothetical protein
MVLVDRQSWIGIGGIEHSRAIQLRLGWNLGWEGHRSSTGWGLGSWQASGWVGLVDLLALVLGEFGQIGLFEVEDRWGGLVENDHFPVCEL